MDAAFEHLLIASLEALEMGESLDSVLQRHPQYAAELRPILETTTALSQVKVAHSLAAQAESRQRFLDRAAALQTGADKPALTALLFRRLTMVFVPLVMVLVILTGGILYASAETIPGDFLYDTKRTVENIRLSLTSNPFAQDQLRENYQNERIREIGQLLASGRRAEVSFSGIIESFSEGEWVVAGLRLEIDESTIVEGTPIVGSFVWVEAKTTDGRLVARAITIQSVPDELPEIEPTPQINRRQTPERPDREVVTPTATVTPSPTSTETPAPTSTATVPDPTDEPVIMPTETPAPTEESNGGEDNDNNDGGNENDGDNENDDDDNENDDDKDENENDNENDNDEENENDDENDDDKDNRNENEEKKKSD